MVSQIFEAKRLAIDSYLRKKISEGYRFIVYPEEWVLDDEEVFENAIQDSGNDDLLISLYLIESGLYTGKR